MPHRSVRMESVLTYPAELDIMAAMEAAARTRRRPLTGVVLAVPEAGVLAREPLTRRDTVGAAVTALTALAAAVAAAEPSLLIPAVVETEETAL